MKTRLNIGAGQTFIPGFINVDRSEKADIYRDLDVDQLPFDDNSVDLVFSYHTLEHLENYIFALGEIHRVLKHGGWFLLGVPHASYPRNIANPYHKQRFNEFSFDFFDPDKLKGSAGETNDIMFREVYRAVHRTEDGQPKKIDFGLIALKSEEKCSLPAPSSMMGVFDECLSRKEPYP